MVTFECVLIDLLFYKRALKVLSRRFSLSLFSVISSQIYVNKKLVILHNEYTFAWKIIIEFNLFTAPWETKGIFFFRKF